MNRIFTVKIHKSIGLDLCIHYSVMYILQCPYYQYNGELTVYISLLIDKSMQIFVEM